MTTWKHNITVESEPLCNDQWLPDMYDSLLYEWTLKYLLPQCLLRCYFSHQIHECVFLFFTSVREDESSKMCLYRSQVCKVVIGLCLRNMYYKCLLGETRKKWMWNKLIIFSKFPLVLFWIERFFFNKRNWCMIIHQWELMDFVVNHYLGIDTLIYCMLFIWSLSAMISWPRGFDKLNVQSQYLDCLLLVQ